MSTPFNSKFFSKAGQIERIRNVGSTLKAALTGKGVQANTPNATINTVLSAAASNPFTTAAAITPANTLSAARAGFTALSTTGKVATVLAAPVVASVIVTNPSTIGNIAELPRGLSNVGSNVSEFIQEPTIEKAKDIFKENPYITGAAAGAAILLTAPAVVGATSNLLNTQATRANTAAIKAASNAEQLSTNFLSTPAFSSEPLPMATERISTALTVKRKKKKAVPQQIRQSVRVNVINTNNSRIGSYIKRNAYA